MPKRLYYIYFFSAAYLFLAIPFAALKAVTALTLPGAFLFEKFHLAALYIPAILLSGGILLRYKKLTKKIQLIFWVSPIPFLTFAITLQIMAGNTNLLAVNAIINSMGVFPAGIIFSLLFVLECAGIIKFIVLRGAHNRVLDFNVIKSRAWNVLELLGLVEVRVKQSAELEMQEQPFQNNSSEDNSLNTSPVEEILYRVLKPEENKMELKEQEQEEEQEEHGEFSSQKPAQEEIPQDDYHAEYEYSRVPEEQFISKHFEVMEDQFIENQDENPDYNVLPEELEAEKEPEYHYPFGKRYEVPVNGILTDYPDEDFSGIDEYTRNGADILEQTLSEFKIKAHVTGIRRGPVITMYELLPSPGVKISSIVNLQDNIALRLAASRVRIVAPIPGKHAIGIEVPNKKRSIVSFSSVIQSEEFQDSKAKIPVILGKDISGDNQIIDLTRTPHLLIAGATGSGKSVSVNSLIASILYSRSHQEVKMIMVDPKIVELKLYNDIPHLLTPVITEPKKALQALQWGLYEMERRYSLLDSQGVRDMNSYNKRIKDRNLATMPLPYIVIIIDEFADLMATSGKELEGIVARLAAMSRAVGIHLVLATQRPSVDVITGLIKANFPSRIAFMVAGKTDSRIIMDAMGAEKLLGRGDLLFTSAWNPFPSRMQGAYLAEEEVERMVAHIKTLGEPDYIDEEMFFDDDDGDDFQLESDSGDDPVYDKALEIVISTRKASASYLQRRLKIGYNRAARLVEKMEQRGIVGPANGSKPRDLVHIPDLPAQGRSSA
ncbi:MAG: hypothetical protein B0D92_05405 [Spirochaeta sp. LUC14_002_19_P3]|nr:MAG: hypothetical protein B0D92_05405 [Spirochaeta sp. LUC14_002_19_P3]